MKEKEAGSALCCTENTVFLCKCFFGCSGRLFAQPSVLALHKLSAATLEQKPAPKRHFKSK